VTANLFRQFPADLAGELVEILAQSARVRIERIVSHGQSSPPGFWYDQAQNEFVLLVAGRARLEFADDSLAVELAPGDWLDLKAHVRHRVAWTDPEQATVWLAVHYC
jgi:cupin 2 domain-containing protein